MSIQQRSRFPFTKTALLKIPLNSKRRTFTDSKCPRLQIRIGRRRVLYWYGRAGKRPRRIKIGSFPDVSIEQARRIAERITGQIAAGEDPTSPSNALTLREAWQAFAAGRRGRTQTWPISESRYQRHFRPWHGRLLKSITALEVERLHAAIGAKHPSEANAAVALLNRVYAYASSRLDYQDNNPCSGLQRFAERSRERYLLPSEVPTFFRELAADLDPNFADYCRLSLFTGARSCNVMAMRWDDLQLAEGVWRIPAGNTKTHRQYTVALSDDAQAVLRRRKTHATSQWVFPAATATGHMRRPTKQWDQLLERCQFNEQLNPHDLRRTLGSWLAAGGASLPQIGKQLGHTDPRSTAIYARLSLDSVRVALSKATAALSAADKEKA